MNGLIQENKELKKMLLMLETDNDHQKQNYEKLKL